MVLLKKIFVLQPLLDETMRVWLDDDRDPTDPLIQHQFLAEKDMVWVKSAYEAIELIKKGKVRYMSLDHDLGIGFDQNTGYEVANAIEDLAERNAIPRIEWRVHSMNPIGAQRMKQALKSAD